MLNKRDFVERYKRGEFGNASPTWNSLEDLERDWNLYPLTTYIGPVHIRNRIAQGETWYNVHPIDLWIVWQRAVKKVRAENLYISAMAPHDKNLIQGEVWQNEDHLCLWYSQAVGIPMRDALRGPTSYAYGILASVILRTLMCPNSWEWLNQLLDMYDNHVVEFSTFSTDWGTIPGYNSVFWEVRDY